MDGGFQSRAVPSLLPQPGAAPTFAGGRRHALAAAPPRPPGPLLGQHEEGLEVEARAAEEGRVREEVEREAHGGAPAPTDQSLEVGPPSEAVALESSGRRRHL